jgi:hypothetical protein
MLREIVAASMMLTIEPLGTRNLDFLEDDLSQLPFCLPLRLEDCRGEKPNNRASASLLLTFDRTWWQDTPTEYR